MSIAEAYARDPDVSVLSQSDQCAISQLGEAILEYSSPLICDNLECIEHVLRGLSRMGSLYPLVCVHAEEWKRNIQSSVENMYGGLQVQTVDRL